MNIWEAPQDIKALVTEIKDLYHPHLVNAKIWALMSDGKYIVDNKLVVTNSLCCTKTEKLKTGNDFKIIIRGLAWKLLTDAQQKMRIDEALCRCGVRFIPQTVVINKKKEVVFDDLGRTIYTTEIATDEHGNPKWKINPVDAGVYFALIGRHGQYTDEIENVSRAFNNLPLKLPSITEQPDAKPVNSTPSVAELADEIEGPDFTE